MPTQVQWTFTDEAPMLATFSLYPIVKAFSSTANVDVVMKDISVAGRIISGFPELLTKEQQIPDELHNLGELAKTPAANIVKLPNISASIPQLKACVKELQGQGYKLPDFPENPATPEEKAIREKYNKVLGSAVNPVLREGNSDRRAAAPVKNYANKHPHKMGPWKTDSKTHVSHMTDGDFFSSEKSVTMAKEDTLKIQHVAANGTATELKAGLKMEDREVLDASCMNVKKLQAYYEREIEDTKAKGILLSLHLKATMMKVSDPIMFGYCVKVFFKDVFAKWAAVFAELKVNANLGFGDVLNKIEGHPKKDEILADIYAAYASRP